MEKLELQFNDLDPETPQMIAFQEKINEIVEFINFVDTHLGEESYLEEFKNRGRKSTKYL